MSKIAIRAEGGPISVGICKGLGLMTAGVVSYRHMLNNEATIAPIQITPTTYRPARLIAFSLCSIGTPCCSPIA
jgi:hypothetical protein